MKLAWLTDIHLNFIDSNARQKFYHEIVDTHCDAVLISGDIAEAPSIAMILKEMVDKIKKPIYFVLGNHDYYRGEISEVKKEMRLLSEKEELLRWLPVLGPQHLTNGTVLLGQDGWADGRYGDYINSRAALNDSRMIGDLFQKKIIGKYPLLEKMQELADADVKLLEENIRSAINQYNPKKIIVLTHVPPFKGACLYQGKISNDDYLPYFSSKATGDTLLKMVEENSTIEFLVLCGHTHGKACYQVLRNLVVKVGAAEYYQPEIQEVITI